MFGGKDSIALAQVTSFPPPESWNSPLMWLCFAAILFTAFALFIYFKPISAYLDRLEARVNASK